MQGRILELVRQQTETRNVGGPAEAGGFELVDLDHQSIARLGPIHIDGAIDRIDLAEIQRRNIRDSAFGRELPGRTVETFEFQHRARCHRFGRGIGIVPTEVVLCRVDRVSGLAVTAHLSPKRSRS